MEKTALGTAILLAMHIGNADATPWDISATFTFYDSAGSLFFSGSGVTGSIDFTAGTGQLVSGGDFQGDAWIADVDAVILYDSAAGGVQDFSYSWTNMTFNTGSGIFSCRTGTALDGCAGITGTLPGPRSTVMTSSSPAPASSHWVISGTGVLIRTYPSSVCNRASPPPAWTHFTPSVSTVTGTAYRVRPC